jgi:hypothetical protein
MTNDRTETGRLSDDNRTPHARVLLLRENKIKRETTPTPSPPMLPTPNPPPLSGWTLTEAMQAVESLGQIAKRLSPDDRRAALAALTVIRMKLGLP